MAKGGFEKALRSWLRGRNGADELGSCAIFIALVMVLVNVFVRSIFLSVFALALMVYSWWRMSSKKINARRRENQAFLKFLGPVRPWISNPAAAFKEARAYKHLTCPSCGQRVRVPRGKGKLRVRCPQCQEKFETKS